MVIFSISSIPALVSPIYRTTIRCVSPRCQSDSGSPGDGLRVDVNVVILSICCYTRLSIERVSWLEGRYQSEEEVVEGSFLVSGRQDEKGQRESAYARAIIHISYTASRYKYRNWQIFFYRILSFEIIKLVQTTSIKIGGKFLLTFHLRNPLADWLL